MAVLELGRVSGLWRYPVKSMAPESLTDARLSWDGIEGDRRWAFVRAGQVRSGFPWLTQRELPELSLHVPSLVEPGRPDVSAVEVRWPDGTVTDIADPDLAAALGPGVRPFKCDRGLFDTMPISLLTTRSVAALSALVGRGLDVRRFRPNLVVEPLGDAAFPEEHWIGSELRIGQARFRVDRRDRRCRVVGVDPASAEEDPAILRAIAQAREACFGVYGSVVQPGRIGLGDTVVLA